MSIRNKLYDWHIFRSFKIPNCSVISIGNITVGGTGKTPAVEFLAKHLIERGKTVAILSRGYRRKRRGTVLVTDGKNLLVNSGDSGDEPYLLAKTLSNVPILVEKNRVKGGRFLEKNFPVDYILLDDAFQHRKVHRDLNIVLIDSTIGFGNQVTLPGGILRERLSGLKRADMIWLTRVDQINEIGTWIKLIKKYIDVPIIKTIHHPCSLHFVTSKEQISLNELTEKKVFIFSGIGNPFAFRRTIGQLKVDLKGELIFRDHHTYHNSDLLKIEDQAIKTGAEWIITTEKDAVRIHRSSEMKVPIFYLKIRLKIVEGIEHLLKVL